MQNRRDVTSSGGSDRAKETRGTSGRKRKGSWSAERHATNQGSPSPEQEYWTQLAGIAFEGGTGNDMISFGRNDQRILQEQQGSGMQSLQDALASPSQQDIPMPAQGRPDQASASKVEEIDEAKCDQIVEKLINPPSKKRKMLGINEKECYKIIEILDEKMDKGEINSEKYKISRNKMMQKIRKAKRYKNNKDAAFARNAKYYKNNKHAMLAKNAKYYKNNKHAILAKKAEYHKSHKDVILAKKAERRVRDWQEALQKADNEIAALEQEIQSLKNQLSLSTDVNQLLVKKQKDLIKLQKAKEHYGKYLDQNLEKARRVIQIQQELAELIGEAPSHINPQESLPDALGESSSHHATQEIRPLEESYDQWLARGQVPQDSQRSDTAKILYAEYHELQRHFEEE